MSKEQLTVRQLEEFLSIIRKKNTKIFYYDPFFDELVEIQTRYIMRADNSITHQSILVLANESMETSKYKLIKKKTKDEE